MMPQRPNPNATGRTPTGAPILTLEDQKRLQAEQDAAYQAALAAQAQQPQAGAGAPPFPGTAPQMESPGLLAQALDYAQQGFRWGQENLGGQLRGGVAPENNPTAAGPGEGIGGRRRREEIDAAVEGKKPARR